MHDTTIVIAVHRALLAGSLVCFVIATFSQRINWNLLVSAGLGLLVGSMFF